MVEEESKSKQISDLLNLEVDEEDDSGINEDELNKCLNSSSQDDDEAK